MLTFFVIFIVVAFVTGVMRDAGTPAFLRLVVQIGGLAALFYGTRAVFRGCRV